VEFSIILSSETIDNLFFGPSSSDRDSIVKIFEANINIPTTPLSDSKLTTPNCQNTKVSTDTVDYTDLSKEFLEEASDTSSSDSDSSSSESTSSEDSSSETSSEIMDDDPNVDSY